MKTQSETIGEIAKALSKAQSEFEPIINSVTVKTPKFSYKYAPLEVCYKATRKALTDNQLSVIHTLNHKENGEMILVTILAHSSGEYFISYTDIVVDQPKTPSFNENGNQKGTNNIQQWGSNLTYLRRYTYCSIIGVVGEGEDTDGVNLNPDYRSGRSNGNNDSSSSRNEMKPSSSSELSSLLVSLIKENGHDPIAFTSYHEISSKKPETVKNAIDNFKELEAKFRNSKNNSAENLSVTH